MLIRKRKFFAAVATFALIICFLVVFSGLASLAIPKPAQAIPLPTATIANIWDLVREIGVSIFKFILIPIMEELLVKLMTTGDLPSYVSNFEVFLDEVGGQILANVIAEVTGLNICGNIKATLKFAIENIYTPSFTAKCSFSDFLDTWKENFSWDNFNLWVSQEDNDFYIYYKVEGQFLTKEFNQKYANLAKYASAGPFFLGVKDCDATYDLDKDGIKGEQPDDCKIKTPGEAVSNLLIGNILPLEELKVTKGTSSLEDLGVMLTRVLIKVVDYWVGKGLTESIDWFKEAVTED